MATGYEDALAALYQVPHETFVAERGRLSAELKTQGDLNGAARLGKLRRPPLSAWAVNQLWWQAREAFEELFATAERVRKGDLAAGAAHRKALTALVGRADSILEAAGHPPNEATRRKLTATLSALAAKGSFDPDPLGALTSDREAPGFGATGMTFASLDPSSSAASADSEPSAVEAREAGEQEQDQGESPAERRRRKEERAKRQAERQRLEVALRAARREADAHANKIERLRGELATAEEQLAKERARIEDIEARLRELEAQS